MKRNPILVTVLLLTLSASMAAGAISGKVSGAKGNAVVYLEAPAGKTFPVPAARPVIDQKGLMFHPHVTAVQLGTTVEFLNSHKVAHNVFWPSIAGNKKLTHNLGTWPQGEKRGFKFDNPGVVTLLCNVHPEMAAYIVVSPTPYFAQVDESGSYKIEGVPDGDYTINVWHEGQKNVSKPVKVGSDTKADF